MQTTSDEVLISRIAAGDRLAMQVLYARHHVRVYRFVLRLVRNEATAEDLISEVFLDIWRQAGKFEGRSAASTWMLSIARFKALSILRRQPEDELDDETAEQIEDHADDPETTLAKKEKGSLLRQCLTTRFLEANKLSIAAGPMAGGLYKVRVAVTGIPKAELARIVKKLQEDKIVNFIAATE